MKIVTAAVLCREGKYLLCERGGTDPLALKWEFPGGKLEEGESPQTCIIREIKEELCLDIEVLKHFTDSVYRYSTGEFLLKAYLVQVVGGTMKLMVHNKVAWVAPDDLLKYDLLPADIEIAIKIGKIDEVESV